MAEIPGSMDIQSVSKPVTLDDVYKNVTKMKEATPAAPTPMGPTSIEKPISLDDVYKNASKFKSTQEAAKTAPKPSIAETVGRNFETANYEMENKKLGAIQSASPYVHDYKTVIGQAIPGRDITGDEKDDSYYLQDEHGNYNATDKNKQVVLRDPQTGKYMVYARNTDTNYGPVKNTMMGLGALVQEGFNAGAPTRLASMAGTATRGAEALHAADAVREATGVHVPVPQNMVTDSTVSPIISRTLQSLPGGSEPFEHSAAAMTRGLERATDEAAAIPTGGFTPTAEAAGETARGALEAYGRPKTGILAQRVSQAYDKVDDFVNPTARHDLSNTRAAAQDLQSRFEATGREGLSPTIQKVLGAATHPEGVTYQGLKDLRSEIGEMIDTGTAISETGISSKQLQSLYKGLSDDMRALVEAQGGERGLQLWQRANKLAQLASKRREELGKILGTNRSDEGIFGSIMTKAGSGKAADAKTLALAKKSMPADEWAEVASAVVSRLGRRAKTGEFDATKFVKDYSELSDRGKALLFGENQRLRKALDSIHRLAQVDHAPSHPSQLSHLLGAGFALNHAGGGEGLVGKLGHALHILGGVVGMRALGNMLTKPATAESVSKWMEGYKLATLKPTRGNVTLFQRATEALTRDAAKEDRKNLSEGARAGVKGALWAAGKISPFGR